jgi:hypothetical protein
MVAVSPGFKFQNHKTVTPGHHYVPDNKTYITVVQVQLLALEVPTRSAAHWCGVGDDVQTDGLGLGAWNKPGRGSIYYAWEAIINYQWLVCAVAAPCVVTAD